MNPLKHALIKSAYKAFAKSDYKRVSTNDIVKEANVSKGLLFHYFKNKENLYLSLYEMAWGVIYHEIFEDFPFETKDLFERLKVMIIRKTQSFQSHTTLAQFIKRVHLNLDAEITKKRVKVYQGMNMRIYKRVFEDIDTDVFKSNQYLDEIYKIVTWTFNRITAEWERTHHEKENNEAIRILVAELTHYIEFFKTFFYK